MLTTEYDYNEDIAVKQEDALNIGFNLGVEQGFGQGFEQGLCALVRTHKSYFDNFDSLYLQW